MEDRYYAACQICKQEMKPWQGCGVSTVLCDDVEYTRITAGAELDFDPDMDNGDICHDCFTGSGKYHHYNCDAETCPVCHEQLIGCECDLEFDEIE
jgi:hypothetical protein